MKRLLALLLVLLAAAPAFAQSPAQAQAVVQTENVRAELLADASAIKPGEPFWVGLRQTIRPKWHTYWKNPGDSGLPTEIAWTLPSGFSAGDILSLGTVSGVAGFSDDPASLYLKPGDVVEAEIERIGVLRNPVVSWEEAHGEPAPPRVTWVEEPV